MQIVKEDDNQWPEPDRVGRQELEVILNGEHISFTCTKLGSVLQVQQSKDPEGLRVFYYLASAEQLRCFELLNRGIYGQARTSCHHRFRT